MLINLGQLRKQREVFDLERQNRRAKMQLTMPDDHHHHQVVEQKKIDPHEQCKWTMAMHPDTLTWISSIGTQTKLLHEQSLVTAIIGPSGACKSLIAQCVSKYVLKRQRMIRWSMHQDVPLSYDALLGAIAPMMIQSLPTTIILQDLDHYDMLIDELHPQSNLSSDKTLRDTFWHRFWMMVANRSSMVDLILIFQSTTSWYVRESLKHQLINTKPLYVKLPTTLSRLEWLQSMLKRQQCPAHLNRHVQSRCSASDLPKMINYHQKLTSRIHHSMIDKMSMHKYIMLIYDAAQHDDPSKRMGSVHEMSMMPNQQDPLNDLLSAMHRITHHQTKRHQLLIDIDHLGKRTVIGHLMRHYEQCMMDQQHIDGCANRINLYIDLDVMPSEYLVECIPLMRGLDSKNNTKTGTRPFKWHSISSPHKDKIQKRSVQRQLDDPFAKLMTR